MEQEFEYLLWGADIINQVKVSNSQNVYVVETLSDNNISTANSLKPILTQLFRKKANWQVL
jgi:hypothetical protein